MALPDSNKNNAELPEKVEIMRRLLLTVLICFLFPLALPEAQAQTASARPRSVEKQSAEDEPSRETKSSERTKPAPRLTTQMIDETPGEFSASYRKSPQLNSLELLFSFEVSAQLLGSIESKLGAPYRYNGTDDAGYDCSGLVWRVFQEAGLGFERTSARSYWENFPEASEEEARMFGTLVFFNDLGHVGIVRDANSFYHASRSNGVILSSLSGYWSSRITGFRRVPFSMTVRQNARIEKPESGELIDATDPAPSVTAEAPKGKKGKAQSVQKEFFRR